MVKLKTKLYRITLCLLLFCLLGLAATVDIDITTQCFRSGQYWNAIVVNSAVAIVFFLSVVLAIIRIGRYRIWLNGLPRDYTVSARGIPRQMIAVIEEKRAECQQLFDDQLKDVEIEHKGFMNPDSQSARMEAAYATIIEVLPWYLESNLVSFYSNFFRHRSMDLRAYLSSALKHGIIREEGSETINLFLEKYEQARFGPNVLEKDQFFDVLSACLQITQFIVVPESDPITITRQQTRNSDSGSVLYYGSSRDSRPLSEILSKQNTINSAMRSAGEDAEIVRTYTNQYPDLLRTHSQASSTSQRTFLRHL